MSHGRRRRILLIQVLSLLCAALLQPSYAAAKNPPASPVSAPVAPASSDSSEVDEILRFNRHTESGLAMYKQQHYEEALQEFRSALLIRPHKGLWANICRTYQQMKRYKDALVYCTNYLDFVSQAGPSASQSAEIERFKKIIEELQQRLSSEEQARIKPRIIFVPERGPRPTWRFVLGGTLIAAGLGVLAAGIYGLSIDGHCVDEPQGPAVECKQIYNARPAGIGFTVAGLVVGTGGAVMIALPGPLTSVAKPAAEFPGTPLTAPQSVGALLSGRF